MDCLCLVHGKDESCKMQGGCHFIQLRGVTVLPPRYPQFFFTTFKLVFYCLQYSQVCLKMYRMCRITRLLYKFCFPQSISKNVLIYKFIGSFDLEEFSVTYFERLYSSPPSSLSSNSHFHEILYSVVLYTYK